MAKEIRILGVLITDRQKEAGKVQALLTKFGCSIKTRLGLHEVTDNLCSSSGLIILELTGDVDTITTDDFCGLILGDFWFKSTDYFWFVLFSFINRVKFKFIILSNKNQRKIVWH